MSGDGPRTTSLLEVWFDPICPWTYIGERRLAGALDRCGLASEIAVVWRSFELDPDASSHPERTATQVMLDAGAEPGALRTRWRRLAEMAASVGVAVDMDAARPVNTHDAHRLVHLARTGGAETAVVHRLLRAYHSELCNIADPAVLLRVGTEAGLSAVEVEAMLASDRFSREVRAERAGAAQLGVRGVPTAVVDQRVHVPLLVPEAEVATALTRARGKGRRAVRG